jgi:aminoglycoside phosphotransferase (APT) family kinase protein
VVKNCDDVSVLGAPFYAMERIRGSILRGPAPAEAPTDMGPLCAQFVAVLARLHAVDWQSAGLTGKPDGYARRQVEGWSQRWRDAQTEEVPEADFVARWLSERVPRESGAALVHNDYKYDNILWNEDWSRIVGVLDWEMATVGDPLMDLGTSLGYWVEQGDPEPLKRMSFGPTFLPGSYTRARLVEEYARLSGRDVSGMLFYFCFGLFKIAVIVQQIYKRYAEGLTKDERFAVLGEAAKLLSRTAAESARRGPGTPY